MNRETLIAILLGFAGGILVAFLLITLPKKFPQIKKTEVTPTPVEEQKTEEKIKFLLEKPENGSLIKGEEIEISGSALENSQIVISGPTEDKVIYPDQQGKFSTKLSVYEGENLITFTCYLEDGTVLTEERTIFATKESL